MKDLWRLRVYVRQQRAAFVAGVACIALSSLLMAGAAWQTQYVFGPLFQQLGGSQTPSAGVASRVPARVPGGMQAWARDRVAEPLLRAAAPVRGAWRVLFGLDLAVSPREHTWRELLASCFLLLLLAVGGALAELGVMYSSAYLSQRALRRLRHDLFGHLQRLSLSFFENRRTGDVVSRVNSDTSLLDAVLSQAIAFAAEAPFAAGLMVVVMVVLSWRLALAALLVLPVILALTGTQGRRVRRLSRRAQDMLGRLASVVEETFTGIRVVKAFGLEGRTADRFGQENDAVYGAFMGAAWTRSLNQFAATALGGVAVCTALLIGAREILEGRLGPAQLMTFIICLQQATLRINRVTRMSMSLQQAAGAVNRLWEVMEEQPTIVDAPDALTLDRVEGRVTFRDVQFAYDGGQPVLRDLNLDIAPGEVVALAGPSGGGKTTIASLVLRLYEPTAGTVAVDGVDVRRVRMGSLRAHIGVVPQEPILFAGTIRENIAYGKESATETEVLAAAEAAHVAEFAATLEHGYDTQVGERGQKLSGGQRQRVAIARALLRDPRILILDEATSSLDAESEAHVYQAMQALLPGRTAIIIAHRLSTIREADRIVVVDQGRIVEEGTHEALMAAQGLYRALYETQAQQPEAAAVPAMEH